jgi:hypothetical protein
MIVIPMAGLSRRFTQAGYDKPKYMLSLGSETVFDHAIGSFNRFFRSEPFLIIVRDVHGTPDFVEARSKALGIRRARIVVLDGETAGQAETVVLGLAGGDCPIDAPATIFNIDTFRPDFAYPGEMWFARSDGYLEVFEGEGPNWSYVRPGHGSGVEPVVLETAEKRPISNLCCTGLYHFARASDMLDAFARERVRPSASELYLAPLYNHLIARGARIHYRLIPRDAVQFCGVPEEYESLLDSGER